MPNNETEQIQYIGARYITKIYENSQNPSSAEWESEVNFEPLTLVTYQNSTYLSRKVVPKTVGNPADNGSYWALTGAYNGQIASLQNQIDAINNVAIPYVQGEIDTINDVTIVAIQNAINTINNNTIPAINSEITSVKTNYVPKGLLNGRRIVILTDSYGAQPVGNSFYEQMLTMTSELVNNSNIFKFAYGGNGFVSNGESNQWYHSFIESGDYEDVTNPETITDFYVMGGCNDYNADVSALLTKAAQLYAAIKTHFPKAKIYVGMFGGSTNPVSNGVWWHVIQNYSILNRYGYITISGANTWLHYTGHYADTNHPTEGGALYLAKAMLDVILGGTEGYSRMSGPVATTVTPSGLALNATAFNEGVQTEINQQEVRLISTQNISITFDSVKTLQANGSDNEIATLSNTFLQGAQLMSAITTAVCMYYDESSVWHTIPCVVRVDQCKLYVRFGLENNSTSFTARGITILPFIINAPASSM